MTLGSIQTFTAVGAIPAGLSMIFEPDGSGIGLPLQLLEGSPFTNFLFPGFFLLLVNGLLNVYGSFLSFRKNRKAGKIGLLLGILLTLWICVQIWITGLIHFLQPIFFVIGIVEIGLSYVLCSNVNSSPNK